MTLNIFGGEISSVNNEQYWFEPYPADTNYEMWGALGIFYIKKLRSRAHWLLNRFQRPFYRSPKEQETVLALWIAYFNVLFLELQNKKKCPCNGGASALILIKSLPDQLGLAVCVYEVIKTKTSNKHSEIHFLALRLFYKRSMLVSGKLTSTALKF